MPAIDRSLDAVAFVTEHFRDILRRRLREIAGLALITLAFLAAVALATWSVQDPSLSHATQTPVHNLLGFPGAIFSDLAMQLLGLAAVILLAPEIHLGWRLLSHRPVGEKWRGLLWILATFFAAAFASALPRVGSWPLPTGLGGVFGDAVLRVPAMFTGRPLAGMLFGIATIVAIIFAAGFGSKRSAERPATPDIEEDAEEDEGDRASAWLGLIAHALLSWKARAGRMLRGTPRSPLRAAMPGATGPRQEPRFEGYARPPCRTRRVSPAKATWMTRRPRRADARRRVRRRAAPPAAINCLRSIF